MLNPVARFNEGQLIPVRETPFADEIPIAIMPGATFVAGQCMGMVQGSGTDVNDVQTLTFGGTARPTGGSFQLQFNTGDLTTAIPISTVSATQTASILAALVAIVGAGNVTVDGSGDPAYVITFVGDCGAKLQGLMAFVNKTLTGGTAPTLVIAHTTSGAPAGGYFAAYNDANSDGTQTMVGINKYPILSVNLQGLIQAGGFWDSDRSVPMYISGTFTATDLTGLDAAGIVDMKARTLYNTTLSSSDCLVRIP